jgi:hypothetical protein
MNASVVEHLMEVHLSRVGRLAGGGRGDAYRERRECTITCAAISGYGSTRGSRGRRDIRMLSSLKVDGLGPLQETVPSIPTSEGDAHNEAVDY